MEKINTDKNNLKKFGITMFVAFFIIGGILFLKHKEIAPLVFLISALFMVAALLKPLFLKRIYIIWMKLAFALGYINTRIILIIIFYLVFTPIGLILKLFGKDLLDRKIEKDKKSYWIKKEKETISNYEKPF